ncbi:hypothetical protein ACJ41O_000337 [Fusarium nematophilum]
MTSPIVATGPECVTVGTAVQVTPDCVDTRYKTAIIDHETDVASPVPHRRIAGHFDGTTIDFNIYLPKDGFDGRFFQLVYPLQNSTAEDRAIGFGADSGGYTNRVAGGGGYRADAAVAKLSRSIAADYYKTKNRKIYGYIYGGSGGSLVTVGAIENTFDVWQGAVPIIQAIPISNPNNFCVRAFGSHVLQPQEDTIVDAVRPGGSGDPYSSLDSIGRQAWKEVSELGLVPRGWEDFDGLARNRTQLWKVLRTLVVPTIMAQDPTYFDDFWKKPGYLGTERSKLGEYWRKSVYVYDLTVQQVIDPYKVVLAKVPGTPPAYGLLFTVKSADGTDAGTFTATLDKRSKTAIIDPENDAAVLAKLSKGVKLHVDNRKTLAASSYHRHQVPTREGFYAWDYLRNADGTPIYPQRSVLIAPGISRGASGGGVFSGNITAKVIAVNNLRDFDAFPWHADWYKNEVQKALGDRFDDNYRLYFNDNADHQFGPVPKAVSSQVFDFTGTYEQHLRDLSTWVEKGREPPSQTEYSVSHGQVLVPKTASQRRGIQAIVDLTSQGKSKIVVKAGRPVSFKVHVDVPSGAGTVTSVEWDFEGTGDYVKGDFGKAKDVMDVFVSRVYQRRGTYYPAVRVATHRDGEKSPYAQIMNLGRMRVVVQ